MNREEAINLVSKYTAAVRAYRCLGHTDGLRQVMDGLYEEVLSAMTATTIEQNVGTIEAGAKVVGVKIGRLG